jgi:hypothetical protein
MSTGNVCKKTVIEVLKAHGVGVSMQENSTDGTVVLAKDDLLETRIIPDECGKRLLQYFQRRFNVPIHHFYNPLMAPGASDKAS